MRFKSTDKIAILGNSGCGKTTLLKMIMEAWPKQVVIDPMSEFKGKPDEIFSNYNSFAAKLLELKRANAKKFRLIFRIGDEVGEREEEIVDAVLKLCYKYGNIQVIVEEVQLHASTSYISEWFKNCLLRGRHKGLSLICVTQRPGLLNKNILSLCQHVFSGQLHEKNDLKYLSNILHDNSDQLPNLPKGKFLYFSPGNPVKIVSNGFKK